MLLPVGMEGAFDSWPRKNPFPKPAVIQIEIGQPLEPNEFADWTDEELLAEIERRIKKCHNQAREHRRRIC